MHYLGLATDYDGTLAHEGQVDVVTLIALRKLLASGRKLILVTGRQLPDLLEVFPAVGLCDRVVAENGAVLYDPKTRSEKLLALPFPHSFIQALRARGLSPLAVGRVIVATEEPHLQMLGDVIREQGLKVQIEFNKGAVMVLPRGIDKASGLRSALSELNISSLNVVGVGDGENDLALLRYCGFSAAVANALPPLKTSADRVTELPSSAGVVELIEQLLSGELEYFSQRPQVALR